MNDDGIGLPLMIDLAQDLRVFSANKQQRIPWGIPSLDIITEGPAAGEVFTVLGRSFAGKSLVATNIMANNPDRDLIFFSLEMPARQAVQRLFATWAKIDHRAVQSMTKRNALPHTLEEMAQRLERQIIVDRGGMTLGDMTVYIDAYYRTFGSRPQAVIIDYLELIGGAKSSGEGWQRTEAVAGALKDWAKDENMPVWVLHQTNRTEKQWDPPVADSARGAGFTEADVVVGMWQPGMDPEMGMAERQSLEGMIFFNVLKNRVTGKLTQAPIRTKLRDTLQIVDLSVAEIGREDTA